MSFSKIDTAQNELINLIPKEAKETRENLLAVISDIRVIQKDNILAWIPISHIDEESVDLDEFSYIDDYEIVTGSHTAPDNTLWRSEEAYREHLEKLSERKFVVGSYWKVADVNNEYDSLEFGSIGAAEDHLETLVNGGVDRDLLFVVEKWCILTMAGDNYDKEEDRNGEYTYESEAESDIEDCRAEWIDEQVRDLGDFEYDEVMETTVFRYGHRRTVNHDLAQDLGMAVVRFNRGEHEDYEYIVSKGTGTDSTPAYVCYQAIEFGHVNENDARWFADHNKEFFTYVVGQELYDMALKSMSLERFIEGLPIRHEHEEV